MQFKARGYIVLLYCVDKKKKQKRRQWCRGCGVYGLTYRLAPSRFPRTHTRTQSVFLTYIHMYIVTRGEAQLIGMQLTVHCSVTVNNET